MLSSLLVGVLSAVLVHAGSQTTPTADPPSQAQSGPAATSVQTTPSGFALTLPSGTLCFGQPRGVHCDRHWPAPEPTPAAPSAAGPANKKSWHFTVLDRTFCIGNVPKSVQCTVRFDPAALTADKTAT